MREKGLSVAERDRSTPGAVYLPIPFVIYVFCQPGMLAMGTLLKWMKVSRQLFPFIRMKTVSLTYAPELLARHINCDRFTYRHEPELTLWTAQDCSPLSTLFLS